MSSTVLAHIPQIVSLFPSLSEISEQDWSQQGIEVLTLEPNKAIQEGQFLEYALMV
ncbi:hypothetical protein [Paenibacillus humicola]|uniref:hypothetical protein n=1 Tax=Paenibacillus humicola TaxID=3110540 RepID=UPI00237C0B7A|nr:hypothetical protein [Paenibacillus humicola]